MRTRALLVVLLLATLGLTGCATGKDAVALGGQYQFVAPHGQQIIYYDPPSSRGLLTTLSGQSLTQPDAQIALRDFPGQVVVINLWGSWCGPCRAEVDDLQQLYQNTKAQGVTVLGIDLRDEQNDALDFARERKITYPLIFDQFGRSLTALNGYPRNVVPSTILLDRQHRVAAVYLEAIRISQLAPAVHKLTTE
jgi:thiol-disulfide isomerase/thioredoxin